MSHVAYVGGSTSSPSALIRAKQCVRLRTAASSHQEAASQRCMTVSHSPLGRYVHILYTSYTHIIHIILSILVMCTLLYIYYKPAYECTHTIPYECVVIAIYY